MDTYVLERFEQRRQELANIVHQSRELIALTRELRSETHESRLQNDRLIEQTRLLIATTMQSLRNRPPADAEIIGGWPHGR